MKKRNSLIKLATAIMLLTSCVSFNNVTSDATWKPLFNGKTLDGWITKIHRHETGVNYGNTFRAEEGMIKVRYDEYGNFNDQFGHLYYKTPFSYYHLKLEYRFSGSLQKGAPGYTLLNSCVMFHSQDPHTMPQEQNWPISIEMQFLAGLGDGQPRPTGNMCSPGTEIVYNGKQYGGHCLNSNSKTYGKDEWVQAELIVLGDSIIKHIINGDTVLQYSKPTMGGGVVERYDPKIWQPSKPLKSGYIALQSEGQPIEFKNILLRKLKP